MLHFKTVWVLIFLTLTVNATILTLENDRISFSVMNAGAIGTGVVDGKTNSGSGIKVVGTNIDHVNSAGIPFEFFSVKIDDDVYANDNAEGFDGIWPTGNRRVNRENIPTEIRIISQEEIEAVTTHSLFQVTHFYTLKQNREKTRIKIKVTIKNLDSRSRQILYTRGVDMDPGNSRDTIDTDCRKGYAGIIGGERKSIPQNNLIYTIRSRDKHYPLSLFSDDKKIPHFTAITNFDGREGCLYDPEKIKRLDVGSELLDADGVVYMTFDLGRMEPNQSKTFTFQYILDKDVSNLIKEIYKGYLGKSEVVASGNIIQYKNIAVYENAATNSFMLKQKSGKIDTKKHTATISLKSGLFSSFIPDGLEIKIGGKRLTKNSEIPVTFKYGKPVKYQIWRNRDYSEEKEVTVELLVKKDVGADDTVKITIKPKARSIKAAIDSNISIIPLIELGKSKPIGVKIFIDNKNLKSEEYKKFIIAIDVDGIDYSIVDKNGLKAIKLLPVKFWPLCLTSTGEKNIKVTVKDYYPLGKAETQLKVNIKKPENLAEWWEVCRDFVIKTLLVLLAIWYLFGVLVRKDKFSGYQYLETLRAPEDLRRSIKIQFKERVSWWQKLIPYKAEWVRYGNMLFYAYDGIAVKLSKKTLTGVKINNKPPLLPDEDEVLQPNDTLSIGSKKYNLLLKGKE